MRVQAAVNYAGAFPEEIKEVMAENDSTDFDVLKRMLPQAADFVSRKVTKTDALKLLLDEHISPDVADGLRRRKRVIVVRYMAEWENGDYLGQQDSACLQEAAPQGLTLVTYDRRTIPALLKAWAEEERDHGGVVFVDEKTISLTDIGGLVWALTKLLKETGKWDCTNRVCFLRR